MHSGTNLIHNSDLDQDKWMFNSHERSLTYKNIIKRNMSIAVHSDLILPPFSGEKIII